MNQTIVFDFNCTSKQHNNPFFAGPLDSTFPYGWKPTGKTYEWRRKIKHISKIDSCEERTVKFYVWIWKCNIYSPFLICREIFKFFIFECHDEISNYKANTHHSSFFIFKKSIDLSHNKYSLCHAMMTSSLLEECDLPSCQLVTLSSALRIWLGGGILSSFGDLFAINHLDIFQK